MSATSAHSLIRDNNTNKSAHTSLTVLVQRPYFFSVYLLLLVNFSFFHHAFDSIHRHFGGERLLYWPWKRGRRDTCEGSQLGRMARDRALVGRCANEVTSA